MIQVRDPIANPNPIWEEKPECGQFIAGGISRCLNQWLKITHDPWVLEVIKGIKIEFLEVPHQEAEPEPYRMSAERVKFIDQEIISLEKKGVLEPCVDSEGQYISNIFLKPKPNGKFRMILDLSALKGEMIYQHFKMNSLQTVMDLISPGAYMASLDLADAYYSVPVATQDRKFLRLRWKGKLYQYTCLPNGLAQAPQNFTKILKPIFGYLAERVHTIFGYIDDTFIMGDSFAECQAAVEALRILLISLGFKIQGEKECIHSHQRNHFLRLRHQFCHHENVPNGRQNY